MRLGGVTRWAIVVIGLIILASDVLQDVAFWRNYETARAFSLGLAIWVRNLLLLAALLGLILKQRWAPAALFLTAALGLWRRGEFLSGAWRALEGGADNPTLMAFHSGADLLFRLLVMAVAIDLWVQASRPSGKDGSE